MNFLAKNRQKNPLVNDIRDFMLLIYIMRFSLYFVHYLHFPQEHVMWIEMLVEV